MRPSENNNSKRTDIRMLNPRILAPLVGLISFAGAPGAYSGPNSFTLTGLDGGRVESVVVQPGHPNVALATSERGVHRTIDSGLHWTSSNSSPSLGRAPILVFDPGAPNRVYALVDGFYRSDDAGANFTQLSGFSDLIYLTVSGSRLYSASGAGRIVTSTDAGVTWTPVTVPWPATGQTLMGIVAAPSNSDVLYVCLLDRGIYRSTDHGTIWTGPVVGSPCNSWTNASRRLVISPANQNRILASTSDGLMLSINGGDNWSVVQPQAAGLQTTMFDPQDAKNVFAINTVGRVIRSTDGGDTWVGNGVDLHLYTGGTGAYTGTAGEMFIASDDGPLYSNDNGDTFVKRFTGIHATAFRDVIAADDGTIYAAQAFGPHGLFKRSGGSWTALDNDELQSKIATPYSPFTAATAPSASARIYASDYEGGVFRSTNGGADWDGPLSGVSGTAVNLLVDPTDAKVAYVAPLAGGVLRTDDGGTNFTPCGLSTSLRMGRMVVDRADPSIVYGAATANFSSYKIYKSTNSCLTWNAFSPDFAGAVGDIVLDPTDSRKMYVALSDGVKRTRDGGATWQSVTFDFDYGDIRLANRILIDPVIPSTVWVINNDLAGFGRSVDDGETWQGVNFLLPGGLTSLVYGVLDPLRPDTLVAAAQFYGMVEYQAAPDLDLTLDIPANPLAASSNVAATLAVANHGPLHSSAVDISMTLPTFVTLATPPSGCTLSGQTLSCHIAPLLFNQKMNFPLSLQLTSSAATGSITATAVGHEADAYMTNNSITKAVSSTRQIDFGLTLAPTTLDVDHGGVARFVATAINRGATPATGSTLSFDLGTLSSPAFTASRGTCSVAAQLATCALGSLAAGETVTVTVDATASAVHTNTLTAVLRDASAAFEATQSAAVEARPVGDLSVTVTDSADPVVRATDFQYVATINLVTGDTAAAQFAATFTGVTVSAATSTRGNCSVAASSVSCALSPMGPGDTATVTITAAGAAAGNGAVAASVTYGGTDSAPGNNSATASTVINDPPAPPPVMGGGGGGSSGSSSGGGGGGGGRFDVLAALLLGGLAIMRGRRVALAKLPRAAGPRAARRQPHERTHHAPWTARCIGSRKTRDGGIRPAKIPWLRVVAMATSRRLRQLLEQPGRRRMPYSKALARWMGPALLACALSAGAGTNSWTYTGPDSGYVTAIAIHPTNSQISLAATTGGLYRTGNGGANWVRVNERIYTPRNMAFDPTSPNRVFVAHANSELWVSNDTGATYELAQAPEYGTRQVEISADGVVYVQTLSARMFKSTDHGATWTACGRPWGADAASNAFAVDPNFHAGAQDHLFMEVLLPNAAANGTWRSVDGCTTWTMTGAGSPASGADERVYRYSVMPTNSNRVLAATSVGVKRSIDGGASWDLVTAPPFGTVTPAWWVEYDRASPGKAVATVEIAHILRSADGGDNWTWGDSLVSPSDSTIALDPQTSGRMLVGTQNGLYQSVDNGSSFVLRNAGMRAGHLSDFTVADDGTVYAAFYPGAAGVFRRNPQNGAWGPVNNSALWLATLSNTFNVSLVATAPTDSSLLYVGNYYNSLTRSNDSGASWQSSHQTFINVAAVPADTAVDPDNALVAYTATSNHGVWKTIDGGVSWVEVNNSGLPWGARLVAAARGSNVVYAAVADPNILFPGAIYKSINGGTSWAATGATPIAAGQGWFNDLVIDPRNPDVVYAPFHNGVYKTSNGGTSWALMEFTGVSNTQMWAYSVSIDPQFSSTLLVSQTLDGAMVRTVDGGAHWQRIEINEPGSNARALNRALFNPARPGQIIAGVVVADIAEYDVATDLALSISGVASSVATSESISASINVENIGPHSASPSRSSVTLPAWMVPTTPAGCSRSAQTLSCDVPALQVGQTHSIPVTLAVSSTGGTGSITGSLVTHETDQAPVNNALTLAVIGTQHADLALTLTPASVTIDRGASTTVTASMVNRGPNPSTSTVLTLEIPAGMTLQNFTPSAGICSQSGAVVECALGTMGVNATATVALQMTAVTKGGHIVVGRFDGAGVDTGTDQFAMAEIGVRAVGDVAVTLAESADPVTVGTSFSYTATLSNLSGDSANVQFQMGVGGTTQATIMSITPVGAACSFDSLNVHCTLLDFAAAGTATVTVNVQSSTPGIVITNATVSYSGTDTNPDNNSASIGTTLRLVGDISVEIADSVDPAPTSVPFTYTVTVRNAGPNAGAVNLTIPVTGGNVSAATTPAGTCTPTPSPATCTISTLASGASATVILSVFAPAPGTVSATATAAFVGVDPDSFQQLRDGGNPGARRRGYRCDDRGFRRSGHGRRRIHLPGVADHHGTQ